MTNSAVWLYTRKNGETFQIKCHLESHLTVKRWLIKIPQSASLTEATNDLMTLALCFCQCQGTLNERMNKKYLRQQKWMTPHVQQTKWFFKLVHKLAQLCLKLLIGIHFLLVHITWHSFSQRLGVLPPVTCAPQRRGSLDLCDSTRSRARADITTQLVVQRMTCEPGRSQGIPGIPGIPAYGARWLCRKTLEKMVENQLMLTSRDL